MGPVINAASKARVEWLIGQGVSAGAGIPVDGRGTSIKGYENGHLVRPTILSNVHPGSEIAKHGSVRARVEPDARRTRSTMRSSWSTSGQYGNLACFFTSSGSAARKFRYAAEAGNIGINIGVAAPMAFFPFSGWNESFFGDMHGQGTDAIEFFTQKKVVVERWPKEWTRRF